MTRLIMVSRELQLLLAIVVVVCGITLLKPEPLMLDEPEDHPELQSQKKTTRQGLSMWVRQPVVLDETKLPGYVPPTEPSTLVSSAPVLLQPIVAPPKIMPTLNVVYLGRLKRAQETYVFLDVGEGVKAFKHGEHVTENWRITSITEHFVQLRDRQSGAVREVEMSRNNAKEVRTENRSQSLSRSLPIQ